MFKRTLQWCSALTVWRRSCALMPKGSEMSKRPRYLQQQLLSALAGSVLKVQRFKLHVVHACVSELNHCAWALDIYKVDPESHCQ